MPCTKLLCLLGKDDILPPGELLTEQVRDALQDAVAACVKENPRPPDPVQFVAGNPDISVYKEGLVISEFMYNPLDASDAEELAGFNTSDFEFIEIKNVGDVPLDLSDIRFTKGIDFDTILVEAFL